MRFPTVAAALAVVVAISLACGSGEAEPTGADHEAAVLLPADVIVVGQEAIAAGPRISGTLEAASKAVLRAEAAGSVVAISAELGDRVEAGQLLARIESTAASTAYTSARSGVVAADQDVKNAERELARVERLVSAGALSPRDLEMAQSALVGAKARLDGAKAQQAMSGEQVEGTAIRAPITGIVSQRAVSEGDVVAPGSPMFTVIEPSSLRLEGSVPASAASALRPGSTVRFQVQGYGDRAFEGQIDRVAPSVDPSTRQIPILVTIPNADGTLMAGLFAEGRVATEQHLGMVVPADAVESSGGKPHVLRVEEGVLARVPVETGIVDPDSEVIELVGGVKPGDVLVLGTNPDLRAGMAVELRGVDAEEGTRSAEETREAEKSAATAAEG